MGVIIINVPLEIKKEFVVKETTLAKKILEMLESNVTKDRPQQEDLYEIVGIWKDRFEDTSENIQRNWRKFLWKRF